MKRARRGRGLTLVELVIGLGLAAVVVDAAWRTLLVGHRFVREQAAVMEVRRGLLAATQVLSAELRELDPSGGDLIAMGPDSVSIRAPRALAFVCAAPVPGTGRLVVLDSLSYGYRAVDPARDRALVFREGRADTPDDDAWLDFGIGSVAAGGNCDGGAAGTGLELTGSVAALDSVTVGSPVRTYERATYRAYRDGDGIWWLGVRSFTHGAWAAISPVAGPLRSASGLSFSYFDLAGAPTGDPAAVSRIAFAVRGMSSALLQEARGRQRRFEDSLTASVALRNGLRGAGP
jgi:hypothetical protein